MEREGFSRAIYMHTVVMLRHGESTWNRETVLPDGPTSTCRSAVSWKHRTQAASCATADMVSTSPIRRSSSARSGTLWITLDALDLMWIPVVKSWKLNERHYGALQGLNKAETAAKHGEAQTKIWRRSYDIRRRR